MGVGACTKAKVSYALEGYWVFGYSFSPQLTEIMLFVIILV